MFFIFFLPFLNEKLNLKSFIELNFLFFNKKLNEEESWLNCKIVIMDFNFF